MYADTMTESMEKAISETKRRRSIQEAYNKEHGITPKTIEKKVREVIAISKTVARDEMAEGKAPEEMSEKELKELIKKIRGKMESAATDLNFELAAEYRDRMVELKNMLREMQA